MARFAPYPIIAGPTASGKTAVAVALAKRLGAEVVSADSMQIYRGVSVGTAAPTLQEMQGIPHHLIGYVDTDEVYSVMRYCEDANTVFADIYRRGKIPVLCGGTGLYIRSFAENIRFFPEESDPDYRAELQEIAESEGTKVLLDRLKDIDPETAAKLHENDAHRIIRALEVYHASGRTISEQNRLSHAEPSPYTPCLILLNFRDREHLYQRIDARIDRMLQNGLVDEARRVLQATPGATILQAIGYKELLPYLNGNATLDEAVADLKLGTRHYAKRQLSWFRHMAGVNEIFVDDYADADEVSQAILKVYEQQSADGKEQHG